MRYEVSCTSLVTHIGRSRQTRATSPIAKSPDQLTGNSFEANNDTRIWAEIIDVRALQHCHLATKSKPKPMRPI